MKKVRLSAWVCIWRVGFVVAHLSLLGMLEGVLSVALCCQLGEVAARIFEVMWWEGRTLEERDETWRGLVILALQMSFVVDWESFAELL